MERSYADDYRYIYFNHMNLALKTSIKKKGTPSLSDLFLFLPRMLTLLSFFRLGLSITREHMKILNDMHADFEKCVTLMDDTQARVRLPQ